ncbi:MAG TPA: amino acid permease, partial [Rubrivivax sp.]|nr:amino acid permease [Rubrivivax sp.]
IGIFVLVVIVAFRAELFTPNLWGGEPPGLSTLGQQVRDTMLLTVFVFVGIEGASVYSRYAKKRDDVGIATVLGFLAVLCLLMLVTLLAYGILPRAELAALANPSMAGVMAAIVGPWGLVFISAGLILSVAGNYLSWTLLAAEVLHSAASSRTMPAGLGRENAHAVPHVALWMTTLAIQGFLIVTWFAEQAFLLALKMTSAMTLLPYLLVAAYGLKLALSGHTYAGQPRARSKDRIVGALATLYAAAMLMAGGAKFLLLSALLYAPGTLLYAMARREQGQALFGARERGLFAALCVAAVAGVWALASGALRI